MTTDTEKDKTPKIPFESPEKEVPWIYKLIVAELLPQYRSDLKEGVIIKCSPGRSITPTKDSVLVCKAAVITTSDRGIIEETYDVLNNGSTVKLPSRDFGDKHYGAVEDKRKFNSRLNFMEKMLSGVGYEKTNDNGVGVVYTLKKNN